MTDDSRRPEEADSLDRRDLERVLALAFMALTQAQAAVRCAYEAVAHAAPAPVARER